MFRVALTFDTEHADRPYAHDATERVYDVLRDRGVTATAFLQGRWVEAFPGLARRIADDGHLIGNHSHHHGHMTALTSEGRRSDIELAEAAIRTATGAAVRPWFRCPFGDGHDDQAVLDDIAACGYRDVNWHVEAADWEPDVTDIVDVVRERSRAHGDGAVVLLHPWTNATRNGIEGIVDGLRADGAEFVTVESLEVLP
jgi:peptidoglycan/xylan/chitin deacetylase (PgdA/CDA1 family)